MQILYIEEETRKKLQLSFDLIIVCDTEGLRAEELKLQMKNDSESRHDNNMGTLVTSISDLSLVNCMGLTTFEITEVLEIVTYALIQSDLDEVSPSTLFVH